MIALTIIFLIFAAILFGIFFLVFKLIWIIAKSKSNKWPLILSGVTTIGFIALVTLSIYFAVQRFIMPFNGLIEAGKAKTTVTDNTLIYNDPTYRFAITTYGDTQFSDWMNFDDLNVLAGFDLNTVALMKQQSKSEDLPVNITLIFRQQGENFSNPQKAYSETLGYLEQLGPKNGAAVEFSEPVFDVPAGRGNAMYVEGVATSNNNRDFNIYMLNAVEDNENYIIIAVANGNPTYLSRVSRSVRSFRLPSRFAPQPLSYTE